MGLDRNTPEGAMVDFASSLDSRRLGHRVVAWIGLAVAIGMVLMSFASAVTR
ncbi:MAG: hypothetical protein ACR2FL_05900 [Nocardioidaceae bacterium]